MGVDTALKGVPQFDQLQLVKTGNTTITMEASDSSSLAVPHNLGYTPIATVYGSYDQVGSLVFMLPSYALAAPDIEASSITFTDWADYYTDSSNLVIAIFNSNDFSRVIFIKYYLYRQSGA